MTGDVVELRALSKRFRSVTAVDALDLTVPAEESQSLYDHAKEPKKVVIMEGRHHYDAFKFTNPEVFSEIMTITLDWFGTHMVARKVR